MMSVVLLLSLTVNVFSSEDLSATNLGFYQQQSSDPTVYKCVGSYGGRSAKIETAQYNSSFPCYYGCHLQYPASDLPLDRDWIQISLYISLAAFNTIPAEYSDDFFGSILWVDDSKTSSYQTVPSVAFSELKPIKVSSQISPTYSVAVLNIMLSKQQYIDISVYRSTNKTYRAFIFPQINSGYLNHYLTDSTSVGMVMFNSIRWSETSDLVPIDEQSLLLLGDIYDKLGDIDNSLKSIDSAINADLVDSSDIAAVESSMAEHSAADVAVNDALQDILNMTVTDINGNTIPLTFDTGYIQNLATIYQFDLSGFAVTNAASIFRHTLVGYITQFGAFIFFPLVLGIIGALMGRPSGA